eukprot:185179-Prymnesium_polylepis.1
MPTSVSCRFNNELQNAVQELTTRESFPFVSMIYPQSTDKKTGKSVKSVPITVHDALKMPILANSLLDGLSIRASVVVLEHPLLVARQLMKRR